MKEWLEGKDVKEGQSPREVIKELSWDSNTRMGQEEDLYEAVMMRRE